MKLNAMKWIMPVVIALLVLISCTEDPIDPVTTGNISGQVIHSETLEPISGANITTTPASIAVNTDISGNYQIEGVEQGTITVKATKTGYKSSSISILVEPSQNTIANIQMSESTQTNDAPNSPSSPVPDNGASDQSTSITLTWRASDPNSDDTLYYDVYLGNSGPMHLISENQTDTTLGLTDLSYGHTYHWQVVARDQEGLETNSPAWSFTTSDFPRYSIVFASNVDGNYNIFTGSGDGADSIRLTIDPGRDWYPRFSPNREKIAFTSNRNVESQLFIMNYDGSDLEQISSIPVVGYNNYGTGFCWNPTGHKLLYANYEKLYRIDSDGDQLTQIATAPENRNFYEMDWSPVGGKIAAITMGSNVYDTELYIMNENGSNMTLLLDNVTGRMGHPTFSPGGDRIAYYYDISGYESGNNRMLDACIHIIDIAMTDTTNLSTNKPVGTNDIDPVWTPDGAHIIFTNVPNDNSGNPSVWIMNTSGESREKLFDNAQMPDWR